MLQQKEVDYSQINAIAKQIKDDVELNEAKTFYSYMDNNIFRDLFASPYRIATSPFYFLAFLASNPMYSYLAIQLLLEETARLISTIIFPIAILYSKHKTDSYNVFDGDLSRMLDRTIALTRIEMGERGFTVPAPEYSIVMEDGSIARPTQDSKGLKVAFTEMTRQSRANYNSAMGDGSQDRSGPNQLAVRYRIVSGL